MAARFLVCRPSFPGVFKRLGVPLLLTFALTFEDGLDELPDIVALLEHGHQRFPLKGSAGFTAEVLKHAADAGEWATVLPNLGEHVVQPLQMPVPVARMIGDN